ncbi:uncharacterized protein K452DRAFT_313263 [Aplosporella prunicola CBS 121167]|uniref:Uncharacterized protein n=1 Tax=Aplosporella prunicola CBS 121167 TaxID=1176127 RepID=A0A6A6AWL9_9PEZI|nr:uncharacterized protein K452DRAFT_313263 [Aplosporella prunicola CBS 121167]KAF2136339.1 hypothetical protein K452DRAFT_313263 [Aplosporella prunicola CBS 121167]
MSPIKISGIFIDDDKNNSLIEGGQSTMDVTDDQQLSDVDLDRALNDEFQKAMAMEATDDQQNDDGSDDGSEDRELNEEFRKAMETTDHGSDDWEISLLEGETGSCTDTLPSAESTANGAALPAQSSQLSTTSTQGNTTVHTPSTNSAAPHNRTGKGKSRVYGERTDRSKHGNSMNGRKRTAFPDCVRSS